MQHGNQNLCTEQNVLEMFQVLTGHYNSRLKNIVDYCSVNKLRLKEE